MLLTVSTEGFVVSGPHLPPVLAEPALVEYVLEAPFVLWNQALLPWPSQSAARAGVTVQAC